MSIHSLMRSRYRFDAFSISAFIPHRSVREAADVAQTLAEVVAVYVGEAHRLQDPDPPRAGDRGHEFGIAARYMAPQMTGTSIPACSVSGVAKGVISPSGELRAGYPGSPGQGNPAPYQDDLRTPGINPSRDISRKAIREMPNLPMKPRGRPVI